MVWSATCSRSFLRLPRSYRPDTRVGSHAVQQPHLKPERDAQHDRPIFVEVAPAALDEKNGGVSRPIAEVRVDIERKLRQEEAQRLQDHWLAGLRQKAYIKTF